MPRGAVLYHRVQWTLPLINQSHPFTARVTQAFGLPDNCSTLQVELVIVCKALHLDVEYEHESTVINSNCPYRL